MESNFFIRKEYVINPTITLDEHPRNYWTKDRIASSHYFQYHVYELAAKIFKENQYCHLLDIGSGPGTKLKKFFNLQKTEVTLFDQPGMDEVVKETIGRVKFFGVNLEDEHFTINQKFDLIICSDVIEHLNNPDALLNIIKNHLADNGVCVLSTPDRDMCRGLANLQSPNKAHVREWNKPELIQYVESRGFKVKKHFNFPLKNLSPLKFFINQLPIFYRKRNQLNGYGCQALVLMIK